MPAPFLTTKLHTPQPRPDLVPRPRLLRKLDEGLRLGHRLTLVCAPAGYGKTTTVATWVAATDRRCAWLSLDEEILPAERHTGSQPSPEAAVTKGEHEKWIQGLLSGLSATDRAASTLRYWYDCSYAEIAKMLKMTVSAVKSRLHRARRALGRAMEGETGYAM